MATGSVLASTAGYAYAGAEAQGGAAGSPGVASGNSVQVPVEVPINACGNTVDVVGALNPSYGNHCANASGHQGGGGGQGGGKSDNGGATRGSSASGASASGTAADSPGVASGNSVQAPVHIPVNACGNSVNVVGVGNPAFGNACGNVAPPAPRPTDDCPESHAPTPPSGAPSTTPPQGGGETSPGSGRTGGSSTGSTPGAPAASTPAVGSAAGGNSGGGSGGPGSGAVPAAAHTSGVATTAAAATGSQLASTGAGDVELLGAAGLALLLGGGVLYRRARAGAR
ncbi:chaplin family protein [Kitasatospora sp. NPDC059747]|uniref:chaplin n=1 Tax=Kitasatospora sp. NPDC059747 TaxID=3346930 RepID=UPI0036681059